MKAFAIDRYKGPVTLHNLPVPTIAHNEVLVEIRAASVNPLDPKMRDGQARFILPYPMPLILGNDMAGVVTRVGTSVTRFRIGDEVYSRPAKDKIGTFAEYIAVGEADLALKPKSTTMAEAASIPLIGLTAWQVMVERAHVRSGQKVFIQAGSGGVGSFAIQLGKHLGATVATTTSTPNVAWVKALGADIVIDYKTTDFASVLRDYDLVFDTLGGRALFRSLDILKPGGRAIGIAGPPDAQFARDEELGIHVQLISKLLSYGIRREARKRGTSYSFALMRSSGANLSKIASLVDQGVIRPVVDRTFNFEDTIAALDYVEKGRARGKVVIVLK